MGIFNIWWEERRETILREYIAQGWRPGWLAGSLRHVPPTIGGITTWVELYGSPMLPLTCDETAEMHLSHGKDMKNYMSGYLQTYE